MRIASKSSQFGLGLLILGLVLLGLPSLQAEQTQDKDGNIIIQPDGNPAQGILGKESLAIVFQAQETGIHSVRNAEMASAPTVIVLYNSEGKELARNVRDTGVSVGFTCKLSKDEDYFMVAAPLQDEDHGKPFSISVSTGENTLPSNTGATPSQTMGDPVTDEDGNIMIQANGKPAQGQLAEDMPSIFFKAGASGPYRIANEHMWSAPTIMVLYDSDGTEVGRNIKDDDINEFVEADLKQGQLYFLILAAIKDEDHGKPFSISVTTATQTNPREHAANTGPTETITGPVQLPQGVDVGMKGVDYSVKRDEQGRIVRLDSALGDGYLVGYRRADETPGLDVWRIDGTYTCYDFLENRNKVSQGRMGFKPDTVMIFDRETGQQMTELSDGTVVTASPDDAGEMIMTTKSPGQAAIQSKMDAAGNLIQGPTRTVTDEQGRPIERYIAGRKISSNAYNAKGQLVQMTLDGGAKQIHRYDSDGQLIETVDVYGGKTSYAYDLEEQQVTIKHPDGSTETKIHDSKGRLIESIGPGTRKMELSYAGPEVTDCNLIGLDEQAYIPFDDGNISIARSSLTGTWMFIKDKQTIKRLDPLEQTVIFTYNQKGALASIKDTHSKALLTLSYDDQANLTQAVTPKTSVEMSYDQDGQLVSEKGSADLTIHYGYNENKMLKSLKDSKGHEVNYVTDDNGQLVQLVDTKAGTIKMTYGAFSLPATLERPNRVVTQWQYDKGGRLMTLIHQLPDKTLMTEYRYDAKGRLSGIDRDPGENTSYSYDEAGYWTSIQESGKSISLKYDAWGQILQHMNLKFNYNEAGHMKELEVVGQNMSLNLTCDSIGRFTDFEIPGNTTGFSYDWDHRLISCVAPKTEESCVWTYDGLGRLAASDVDELLEDVRVKHKREYVYAMGELYGVFEAGKGLDRYIMLPGTNQCVAVVKADGTVLYPLWDHMNSIIGLTDVQGGLSGSRVFASLGDLSENKNMPIAIGHKSGLSFMQDTMVFTGPQPVLLPFHRTTAAEAPWPYQSSLRKLSPFIAPSIERSN